ncbi:MAG: D-alanyl-D-alanine carboxypeptidase [Sphingobacteriia bacterium]|nr:D-alanyl-D-alanine carboxypeptidase [Sphingobacteriia bacterium]
MRKKLTNNLLIIIYFLVSLVSLGKEGWSFDKAKYATLVVDQATGKVLYEENAEKTRYPASITKVMTLYLAFEALAERKVTLGQQLTVSKKAAHMPRTNLNLKPGQKMTFQEAIHAAAIKSANDAAIVIAEAVAGSEEKFVKIMNMRAKMLGMKQTHYSNPTGLPDPEQKSSAYDIARLAIAIQRDYPEYYHIFSKKEFKFKGKIYKSTNNLLTKYKYNGLTGLKTGFTNMSGFNLVSTAQKGHRKIVAVVMGGNTSQDRDKKMISLLNKFLGVSKGEISTLVSNSKSPKKKIIKKSPKKKIKLVQN